LRREEEYIWASDLKRSREYVSVVQEARKLTDYLTNEQNNSREKLDSLTRNR
jgi:CRISPR/Cas system CMR-associated protein Cmr1 (group 7 of RAMP superfamily)